MQGAKFLCAATLAVSCGCALADGGSTGQLTRDGKTTAYTAVHVEPPHRQINFGDETVVFSDDAKATEAAAKIQYGTIDGVLTADTVAAQLRDHGAHPITLKISPPDSSADGEAKDQRNVEIVLWNSAGKPPDDISAVANAPDSKVQLKLTRDDDQRLEGTATLTDHGIAASLPFALDKGPLVFFGKKLEMPPPPPPPPPPPKP